jgi:hypothetical protein
MASRLMNRVVEGQLVSWTGHLLFPPYNSGPDSPPQALGDERTELLPLVRLGVVSYFFWWPSSWDKLPFDDPVHETSCRYMSCCVCSTYCTSCRCTSCRCTSCRCTSLRWTAKSGHPDLYISMTTRCQYTVTICSHLTVAYSIFLWLRDANTQWQSAVILE